jgi:hypothetical protein
MNLMNSKKKTENLSNRRNLNNPKSLQAKNLKSPRAPKSLRSPKQRRNHSKITNLKSLKRARNHKIKMMDTQVRIQQLSLKTRNLQMRALKDHQLDRKRTLTLSR